MAYADRSGRARTNPAAPRAFAVCDSCGEWYNRVDLIAQYEFAGSGTFDTGFRDCPRCISKPQAQLKTVVLPLDPQPIFEPRPEASAPGLGGLSGQLPYPPLNSNANGFAQVVGPQGTSILNPVPAELDPTNPIKVASQLIASAQTGWGVPYPALRSWFGMIALSGVGQLAVPANLQRTYLLVYNPFGGVLAIAQNSSPTLGISSTTISPTAVALPQPEASTVIVGTGSAVLQNGLLTPPAKVWTGEIWVLGLLPGAPWWIWEGPGGNNLDFRVPQNAVYLSSIAGV